MIKGSIQGTLGISIGLFPTELIQRESKTSLIERHTILKHHEKKHRTVTKFVNS